MTLLRLLVPPFLLSSLVTGQGEKCSLCPASSSGVPSTKTGLIIPQLQIPGGPNPTCQGTAAYASIIPLDDPLCLLLQAQAPFCGCADAPLDSGCRLCPNNSSPAVAARTTPYGDTCAELDLYLQTQVDCTNERIQKIQQNAFGCGCPTAQTACAMCPDGTLNMDHPDRVIPFLSTGEDANPTCMDIALLAASSTDVDCGTIQAQAGYCGCANVPEQNVCSFCPNFGTPTNPDLVTVTTDTCQDLNDYMKYVSSEDCSSPRVKDIQALDHVCGCPNAAPECTLCPDGSDPPFPDLITELDGPTCGEIAQSVASMTLDKCEDQQKSNIGIAAARCQCPNAKLPVCILQQNPHLCTTALLATAASHNCECFAFCDTTFFTCNDYPGGLLSSQLCSGVPIAGCNLAMAQKVEEQIAQTGNDSEDGAVGVSLGVGMSLTVLAWVLLA